MTYHLPTYPSSRLETLMHLDMLARTMITQHENDLIGYKHCGAIIPRASIIHTGSMVMTLMRLITTHHHRHYTFIYDVWFLEPDSDHVSLDDKGRLITSFGHKIPVKSASSQIPIIIEQLCCMIQIYQSISQITILHPDQLDQLDPKSMVVWIAGNLHHGYTLQDSLIQDELALTQLTLGQVDDTTLTSYHILHALGAHYRHQDIDYNIIPVSYHNTALLDGQKKSTTSYCAALIIKE